MDHEKLNNLERRVRELEQSLLEAHAEREKAHRAYRVLYEQTHGKEVNHEGG